MAITGTLNNNGIVDILQLIALQNSSGTIIARRGYDRVAVYFKDGSIIRGEADGLLLFQPIGQILLRARAVTPEALSTAVSQQRTDTRRLGEILVEMGDIQEDAPSRIERKRIWDSMFIIMGWSSGTYSLEYSPTSEVDSGCKVRIDHVLMESHQWNDQWPRISRALRLLPERFMRAPDCRTAAHQLGDSMTEDLRYVLGLIDGASSLDDVLDRSLDGMFGTYASLLTLFKLGLLIGCENRRPSTPPPMKAAPRPVAPRPTGIEDAFDSIWEDSDPSIAGDFDPSKALDSDEWRSSRTKKAALNNLKEQR
jgi:hypothetical protein